MGYAAFAAHQQRSIAADLVPLIHRMHAFRPTYQPTQLPRQSKKWLGMTDRSGWACYSGRGRQPGRCSLLLLC
jgi:hypothetical protein